LIQWEATIIETPLHTVPANSSGSEYPGMNQSDLEHILKQALAAIDAAGVTPELREAAFNKSMDLLASPSSAPTPPPLAKSSAQAGQQHPGVEQQGTKFQIIAEWLRVDAPTIDAVFDVVDGELELALPTAALPKARSKATEEIALLLAAGRQALGEERTPVDVIRGAAAHYNKIDANNFAGTLKGMDHWFALSGSGSKRTLKLKLTGREAATSLVKRLGEQNEPAR
jgi:hypothetical protein